METSTGVKSKLTTKRKMERQFNPTEVRAWMREERKKERDAWRSGNVGEHHAVTVGE